MKLRFKRPSNTWYIDTGGHVLGRILCVNLCKTMLLASLVFSQVILRQDDIQKELMLDHYSPFIMQNHIEMLREKKYQLKLVQRLATHLTNITGELGPMGPIVPSKMDNFQSTGITGITAISTKD